MSTRTNIVLEYGESRVFIYRHCDGYPSCTGADLVEKLQAQAAGGRESASKFLRALLADQYDATEYSKAKPIYELTTEIHGDIDYLYRVAFGRSWDEQAKEPRIGVLDLTFSGGNSELRDNAHPNSVKLTDRATFVAFVNKEIREMNARAAAYYAKQGQTFEPQAELVETAAQVAA